MATMRRHVLVVRLSALGDVAIAAPVLRRVAEANPEVLFTMAAPPMLAPLFDGEPNVRFVGVSKKQSASKIYAQLRAVEADAVADLHRVNKVGWALRLLWLHSLLRFKPLRVAHLHKGRWSRWRMLHHCDMRPRRSQAERYADVFRRLGLTVAQTAEVQPHRVRHAEGEAVNIGVAPFAQHAGKVWPTERMEATVAALTGRGYRVWLFGSKAEASVLEAWAARYEGVESVAGRLSFGEELALMGRLTLMVSMDSANMHFASVAGTPVVSIWGATHPDFGFYGYRQERDNALCANLKCQPCSAYGQRPCRYGDYRCLREVAPQHVIAKIEALLRNNIAMS